VLYFNDDYYKNIALNLIDNKMNVHSCFDSFIVLIKDLEYEDLNILCKRILMKFDLDNLDEQECYRLIQSNNISDELKRVIYDCAVEIINENNYLGSRISNGYNTSAWINHCYYVGECCSNLANIIGLDPDKARTYGLLHDVGRKKSFSFDHVIYGFEYLISVGYTAEAIGCLTHSFVNGGRCSNNEKAIEGFYLDKNGNANFKDDVNKDDVALFLEQYQYNEYDILLNISDLMAVNKGVVSPYDRIQDIATRREIDLVNRGYFLADITNVLIDFLKLVGYFDKDLDYVKADENTSLKEIDDYFKEISKYFYEVYTDFNNKKLKI